MNKTISAWHGTRGSHEEIDVAAAIARHGYAQHGDGLYLTTSLADALSFALPRGFVWRCDLDAGRLADAARKVVLGDGIVHYVVTDQATIVSTARHAVVQDPPHKLGHAARKLAAADPPSQNVTITPPIIDVIAPSTAPTGTEA